MRIHAIQTGTVRVKERQRHGVGRGPTRVVRTMASREWTEPLPILAWLIEHPEGLIVVDTGETARALEPGWMPRWHPYFRLAVRLQVEPDQEIGPQLERLGFSASDVRQVVLTHLHTDHVGGLHHFPRSEVLLDRAEADFALGRLGKLRGYLPHRLPEWFEPTRVDFEPEPFGPFARSRPLTDAGDVVLLPTPGHTPGHMSVAVRTAGGPVVLLAGDTSYTQALMIDGVADGVTGDVAGAQGTLARIRELAAAEPTVYLPSHDPDGPRRLDAMETVEASASS
jgi:glyoxylase-like metal-dependent hydrolase (beta-lactamase superfamily II)